VFWVYWPVGHYDFVNYDDPDYVTANPPVAQGVTADSIRWALTSGDAANWLPLTRLSYLFDRQLFGADSGAEHLVNVFLHACTAILLFLFLRAATNCLWPSVGVAFFFALHPLHVESVAWISERKDVLCAFFFLATLCAYLWYVKRPRAARYGAATVSFALALMSKPMAVTLPFVLLLLDYWPLRRRGSWREKVPFFLLAAVSAAVTLAVQQSSGAVKALANFPLPLRMENAFTSYAVYIGQTFWPARLAVFYPFPADIPVWKPLLGAAVLFAGFGCTWRFRQHRYVVTGWLWFVITLVPVIGIIQVGAQSHADRYMYLPMTGLLIMLAWGALNCVQRWPRLKSAVLTLGATCAVACAVSASVQLRTWRNSGTLFEHALRVTRDNYIAEHNLGSYLLGQPGQLAAAEDHLRKALALNPDSVQARNDLGIALAKDGKEAEAAKEFQSAARLDATAEQPRRNLETAAQDAFARGVSLMKANDVNGAIQAFQAALQANPRYAEAHNDLGMAYTQIAGHLPEAISEFETAIRLKPDYVDAQYNLGAALSQVPGRERESLAHFQIVERLRPDPDVERIIRQLRAENATH
jgi:Flp pilus assembly protein TadD